MNFHSPTKDIVEGRGSYQQSQRASIYHDADVPMPMLQRWVILDVIFDPFIVDETKLNHWEHDLGVTNMSHAAVAPRNSIVARRVLGPGVSPTEGAMVLYPFFPSHLALPAKPGEHVWVMFEDVEGTRNDLGYWMCRIVGPEFVDDVNHTHAPRAHDPSFAPGLQDKMSEAKPTYELRNGTVAESEGKRYTVASTATLPGGDDAYRRLTTETDAGPLVTHEAVPRYKKRPGEYAFEGTNNTLIVLGEDRTGASADVTPDDIRGNVPSIPSSDKVQNAGFIDIVAGRGQTPATSGEVVQNDLPAEELAKAPGETSPQEGDPDLMNDRARVRVHQRTSVDSNFGLVEFNLEFNGGTLHGSASGVNDIADSVDGDGATVFKADKLRFIARSDIEILVTTYTRDDKGRMVTVDDTSKWAAVVIKANGDIVFRPAEQGFIKLGGDDAVHAVLVNDQPSAITDGEISAPPIVSTMGGFFGGTKIASQGKWARKLLAT